VAAAFVRTELRTEQPILDLALFEHRGFRSAIASAVLNYGCAYCIVFALPFYPIGGRGLSPAQAGLLLTVQPAVMTVVSPVSGTLSDSTGARVLSTSGALVVAAGCALLSRLDADSTALPIVVALAAVGLGAGLFTSPNNSALLGAVPRERRGVAAAVMATSRNVGMALGIGLAGAVFATVPSPGGTRGESYLAAARLTFGAGLLVALGAAGASWMRGRPVISD
jgi:MFS family permease